MDNGTSAGVGFSDAGVLALLADTNRAGRGGYWGGEGGYGGGYGNIANAVRLDRNEQNAENQADCTRDLFRAGLASIRDSFEGVTRQNQFNDLKDGQFRAELRTNDRLLALQAEMNQNARIAAECCCELKLNQCKDTASIMARMEALSKENVERDLDRAERENIYLRTISACGCGCGGGVRPCPPTNGG